jgi:Kef-type K+ transport system membrane component KefB
VFENISTFPIAISLALFLSYYIGNLFLKIGQPKVMAEITVGLILGPSLFGLIFPDFFQSIFNPSTVISLNFLKEVGLILLMFCSGYELRHLDPRKHLKVCFWGVILGIGLPALLGSLLLGKLNILDLIGTAGSIDKLNLIMILSMAVTSIPVISRILMDLNLIKSSFAQMVLAIALVEDLILYALLNAALTSNNAAIASSTVWSSILGHILISAGFLLAVIFWRDKIYYFMKRITLGRKDLETYQYLTLILASLFLVIFLLSLTGIVSMLSALGCGMILGSGSSNRSQEASEVIRKFSFAIFIPIYFVMVGFKINILQDFSLSWFIIFFLASSIFKILGGFLAGKFSKFSNFKSIALGFTLNARGGPGIVIATTALEAGIINKVLFSTLIFTALFTSSIAGSFLKKFRSVIQSESF